MISVVFDLDGTLVDSIASIGEAANALMFELGLEPLDAAETRSYVGNGAGHFVERARGNWNAADAPLRLERFLVHYAAVPGAASSPLSGVDQMLRQLRSAGYPLAICTNKPTTPTDVILTAHGWTGFFEVVVCGDTLAARKPEPEPLHEVKRRLGGGGICFVGDSEVDAETAVAAGVAFFLYTEGYRASAIDDLPHTAHFSDFSMLPQLVEDHFS